MFFRFEAEYDTLFIEAPSLEDAQHHVRALFGRLPEDTIKWTEVDEIPEGEVTIEFEDVTDEERAEEEDLEELDFDDLGFDNIDD